MELEFIEWLRTRVAPHPNVRLGLGDDAALLSLAANRLLVVTSDLLTDGVDFVLDQCDPVRVGRKALAVNLSDLAAMAARPMAVIVSIALPTQGAGPLARAIYEGIFELAAQFDVALAGGDTNTWDGQLVISITALGQASANGALRRSGARPGDVILATGSFGGSILGHHFDFQPRVREAMLLHEEYELHAGIDVSDGLSLDLLRMASESHCGAALAVTTIPIDPAAFQLAHSTDPPGSALEHALADGEDFELLLAAPEAVAEQILRDQPLDVPITRIGHFVREPGLWELVPGGTLRPMSAKGWQHGGE